jgi:predicted AAA+ superfamily ATPase
VENFASLFEQHLAQIEMRHAQASFLARLFNADFKLATSTRLGPDLAALIVAGGFPAALARQGSRRRTWYQAYMQTLIQRDVRDLARISALDVMPHLLQLAARQTAHLFNVSELASPFGVSRPTIRDYLTLLERVFLVELLPPWHLRHINRLVKTPKLHLGDTGLAAALLKLDASGLYADRALFGQLLETFVFQELRRQSGTAQDSIGFFHFRNRDDHEVDIVLEQGALLAGVEVKASGSIREEDFRGLRKLQEVAGERFACGVVLYDGEVSLRFGPKLFALPMATLWTTA